ncbi:MAG: ABC transporter permease, partial [Promethearchaeota archaeon]
MLQIYKTVFRELRFNKKRTFLSFLVIFVIVAFPLAMFSIDPSIDASVVESNKSYQLSYLDVRFQGSANEIRSGVESLIESYPEYANISFDIRPTTSFQLYQNSKWYYTSIVGVNTSAPPTVNQFVADVDISELRNGTAFILESFAKELDVEIGDSITLYTPAGEKSVEIAGLVKSIEFLSYDLALEGALYLNYDTFQEYNDWDEMHFNSVAFYFPDSPDMDDLEEFSELLREEVSPVEAQIFFSWYVREFSISAIFQDVLSLTSQILFIMACAIILAAGIVIYLITKRYAVEQRKQTGMLYAYGFSSKTIMKVFMLRTLVLSLFAIAVGTVASYGLLQAMVRIMISRWGIPTIITRLSPLALGIVPVLVILTSQIFTYFACVGNVRMTPYEAIRGKAESMVGKKKDKKSNEDSIYLSSKSRDLLQAIYKSHVPPTQQTLQTIQTLEGLQPLQASAETEAPNLVQALQKSQTLQTQKTQLILQKKLKNSNNPKNSKYPRNSNKWKSKIDLATLLPIQIKYPLRNISRNRKRGILITAAFIGAIAISFALIQTQTSITGTFNNYFDDQIHWDAQTRFDFYKSETEIDLIFGEYDFIKDYEPYLHGNAEILD